MILLLRLPFSVIPVSVEALTLMQQSTAASKYVIFWGIEAI